MLTIGLTLNDAQIRDLMRRLDPEQARRRLRLGLVEGQQIALREIVRVTPAVTGVLRASIATGVVTDSKAEVTTRLHYAPHVEEGTRPHTIRPSRARILSWSGSSGRVFARSVRHPGTKGAHMFARGMERAKPRIIEAITRHLQGGLS